MDNGKYETVDEETGEIIEGAAEEIAPQPRYETAPEQPPFESTPVSRGEIIPPGHDRSADGALMRTVAHTGGNFVDMLEDGQFSREVHDKLAEVAAQMSAITNATGRKTKGRITLTFDLEKEGEHFTIQGKIASKMPELPRPKSIVWNDDGGNFTRFPPQQTQMFGLRPARNVS